MLYLDNALELHGITLFRDYNAPNRFYYMPRSPHLTIEAGQPMFQLLIYRRDITDNPDYRAGDRPGGGFLTMTVDLGVSEATLAAIRGELEGRVDGEVDLVPVPLEGGSVRISALGASAGAAPALAGAAEPTEGGASERRGPHFVENILGAARPSLYGDNRAVFTLELSHEGALLMRASLQDPGASQVAVIYDLEYRGLMPAYEARITIDFRQVYTFLRSRFTLNTLVFRADIDNETERLIKEGHIKIEDVDYLSQDPAKMVERAQRLRELAKELATWSFFRPGLQPGQVLATDRGELRAADPTAAASAVTAGFSTPLQVALTGAGRTAPGQANVGGRTDGAGGIAGQDPVAGAENTAASTTTPEAGERPLTAVEAWNKAGRPQAALLLRSLTQEEQQTITFDLRQVSAAKRSAGPQGAIRIAAGAASLAGRIKEIDLNDPFFERLSGTVISTADFASTGVKAMVVKIRYGVRDDGSAPKDSQEFLLRAAGDRGSFSFFMDRRRSVEIEYQVVLNYDAGFAIGDTAVQATSPWIRTSTLNLDVDPRIVGAVFPVGLTVGQCDWSVVQGVQSKIVYEDAGNGVHAEHTLVLTREAPTASVPIRPKDPARTGFQVTTTWMYAGGQETVAVAGQGATTLVLNQPVSKVVPVSLIAVDPLGRYQKIAVELVYAPGGAPEQTRLVELAGANATATWSFIRATADAAPKYRHRITLFARDGTTSAGEWQETTERHLIVGDRFEGMLEVDVRVVGGVGGDLGASGYQGALLTLEYPDAPEGVDARRQEFLTGVPRISPWRVPTMRGRPRAYRWELQLIRNDGSRVTQSGDSRDEVLVIFIPPAGP